MIYLAKREHEAIKAVVNYLWKDEEKNYEECNEEGKKKHIFNALKKLKRLASLPIL